MKVWLVHPRTDDMIRTEVPGYVSKEVGHFPPLGLLYLAADLRRRRNDEVRVIDMPAEDLSYEEWRAQLEREKPHVVGVTAITHNLVEVRRCVQLAREAAPEAVICIGGPHVDAFPEASAALPGVDAALRGEGEGALAAWLDCIENRHAWSRIPGLCFRREDGELHVAAPATPPTDLDALAPPARDLVNPENYYYVLGKRSSFVTMLSSRGCPHRCIFCSTPHGRFRERSPQSIADEIEACIARGAREFHFVDDTFNLRRGRLEEISETFLRRALAIRWSFRGRVDTFDAAGARLARRAGCERIHFGVETGCDAGLEILRKGNRTEQVEHAIRAAREAGITTAAYFLIGCPHETSREKVLHTIRFACRVNPDFALFNILAIYPHTELHEMAVEKGLIAPEAWQQFALNPTPDFQLRFWEEHLDAAELTELLQRAYRRFYLRPRLIWRNLRQLGSWAELRHKAAAACSILGGGRRVIGAPTERTEP